MARLQQDGSAFNKSIVRIEGTLSLLSARLGAVQDSIERLEDSIKGLARPPAALPSAPGPVAPPERIQDYSSDEEIEIATGD